MCAEEVNAKVSFTRLIFWSILFFLSFYRISFLHSSLYLSVIISIGSFFYLNSRKNFNFLIKSIPALSVIIFIILFLYSLSIDLVTDNLVDDFSSSFAIRLIFMLLCSILPAYLIVIKFLKGSKSRLVALMKIAFLMQTFFFMVAYISPDAKSLFYSIMGASQSVNLNEWNMGTRGFGMSNEINYTSPFLMVILSIYFFRGIFLRLLIFVTQVFNSNNVVLAALLGLVFSKSRFLVKASIASVSLFVILFFAVEYLPRLKNEFANGGGSQTILFLFEKHFYALNEGVLELLGGTGIYIYGASTKFLSDMGFVIIFNYGGIVYSLLFAVMILSVIIKVGYSKWFVLLWLITGVALNFKGLLLGANGYMFMTFLFLFNNSYSKRFNNVQK